VIEEAEAGRGEGGSDEVLLLHPPLISLLDIVARASRISLLQSTAAAAATGGGLGGGLGRGLGGREVEIEEEEGEEEEVVVGVVLGGGEGEEGEERGAVRDEGDEINGIATRVKTKRGGGKKGGTSTPSSSSFSSSASSSLASSSLASSKVLLKIAPAILSLVICGHISQVYEFAMMQRCRLPQSMPNNRNLVQ
jgi:hypothetical protein